MNRRNKNEKAAISSSNSDDANRSDEALLERSLKKADYEKLLLLWQEKGAGNSTRKKKVIYQSWRSSVLANLKSQNGQWQKVIQRQAGEYRYRVEDLLDEAAGDPLMLLNLLGVSPHSILYVLETLNESEQAIKALRPFQTSLKEDRELFEHARRRLRLYERAFPDVMYEAYGSLLSGAGPIKAAAKVLKDPRGSGIIDKRGASRGAPAKDRLRSTIKSLVCACELPLEERLGKPIGGKIMWAAITAILMCAFPEMFRVTKNREDDNWRENANDELKRAIRQVKDGYRLWLKEYELIPSEMQ